MGIFDGVLLVSDYDDTLYDRTFTISAENRTAIARFLAEGGLFSISTGRSYLNFAIQMEREHLPISVPVILSNGASIYDFGQNRVLWERTLPVSAATHLQEVCTRFPEVGLEAYHGDAVYTFRANTVTERHLKRCRLTGQPRPIEAMPAPWLKIILQHEETAYLEAVQTMLLSQWGTLYDVTFSNPTLLEMTAKGANKGEAVLRLAEYLHIRREHLYCIGNGMNDIPMLAVSAIPYAPADSYPQVLAWGARVLPPCNESCVARMIAELEERYADRRRKDSTMTDHKNTESPNPLADRLRAEKSAKLSGGIYHKIQIDLTYNSNHIEGSGLTHEQTRNIFETNTIGLGDGVLKVDDVVETANHFRCVDMVIDHISDAPDEALIKQLHATLKGGTSDSRLDWFAVGEYKKIPNEVGGRETVLPEQVAEEMHRLLAEYNARPEKTLDDLLEFHVRFERIHPFQDGNGRVGRLLLFKECLRYNIVPFILGEPLKLYYYRGLREWRREPGYLRDTCLTAQDAFKKVLDYFRIAYREG